MNRNKCVICDDENLIDFLVIKEMPAFMGVTEEPVSGVKSDMILCECQNCNNVQLRHLLDLNLIYSINHNTEIVGELWNNHYTSFLKFVNDGFDNKTILEVGDPSAKIAKLSNNYNKWIIVEKNPDFNSFDKVEFINKFFEEEFVIDDKIDVIVHSHFFEHLYEPKEFLKKCHSILSEDGDMFFSIPDLRNFLEGDFLPNSILQFEHTYFIDKVYLEYLCQLTGFYIVKSENYNNHSVFFHLKKDNVKNKELVKTKTIKHHFIEKYQKLINKIEIINKEIENDDNVFLYGSHVTSQSYLYNGLDKINIKGLLDGSVAKIGKYLYSTDLFTYEPQTIESYDKVTVICSHMGIYKEEISDRLISINPFVKIL